MEIIALNKSINDLLNEAARQQNAFENAMLNTGHEAKTLLFQDFAIADYARLYGEDPIEAVTETYNEAKKALLSNVNYFAELVIVLNWRMGMHFLMMEKTENAEGKEAAHELETQLYETYLKLYQEADTLALDTYEGEDAYTYYRYYRITD